MTTGVEPAKAERRRLRSPRPLAKLLPLLRPYRGRLAVAAVCLLVAAGVGLAFPAIVGHLLDSAFQAHSSSRLNSIAIGLLALFALQGLMNFVQVYLLTSTTERVIAKLREDLFSHLVRLSPGFFAERRSGELTSRLSTDLALLQSLLSTWVSELSRQSLFLIGGIVLLTVTRPQLATTTLAIVPIVVGIAFFFGRRLRKASVGVQDRIAEAMGNADEAFSQIRTVQSFNRETDEARRYGEHLAGVVAAAIRRAWIRAGFFGIVGFIAFGGVVAVLWKGGQLVLAGTLTPGALVAFLLYAITVAAAVGSLASLFGSYQEAIGAAQRVFELLELTPTVAEPAEPRPLVRPVRGDVSFNRVRFRYGPELPEVLSDISFQITPGEVVALVGPSGAGKTTIASLLPRFWDVSDGCIALDGVDIRALSFRDLRGAIGIVPQDPALFSGTVRDNIGYSRPASDAEGAVPTDAEIIAAARAAHALEFVERLPQGFDTRVGERGVKLSGGQRQRIAIARVFLRDPAVVVLDEATSSLDTESERMIEAAMEDLLRGRSTLIIAHRLSTVRRADRVLVLDHGRIVEEGRHEDLMELGGLYARLYRAGGELRG
ncbi:MAG TPA: ABC transporter transmembrane domain-containing protein [Gemmatimonadaceae bacterium]|nr:ABC transporter transmembrane domain-containing protein [Gemmatimonadaceae bacterium]